MNFMKLSVNFIVIIMLLWGIGVSLFAQKEKLQLSEMGKELVSDSSDINLRNTDTEDVPAFLSPLINSVQVLSPQATSLARYGEYPVSLATGIPNISIPLYTIRVGEFTLPINISYHAAGNKVNDVASPVGLGWVLNAGGAISRTVKNRIDRLGRNLYDNVPFYTKEKVDSMKLAERSRPESESANLTFWNGVLDLSSRLYDTESDRYCYNFCGYSGIFRYSFSEERFRTIPHVPFIIEMDNAEGYFTITDAKGIQYIFGQEEKCGIWDADYDIPVNTYYLTKINLASTNDSIIFEYDNVPNIYGYMTPIELSHKGMEYDWEYNQGNLNLSQEKHLADFFCQEQLLKKIKWHDGCIELNYVYDRSDNASARLANMIIKDNTGNTVKQVAFDNSIHEASFADGKSARLFLDGLTVSGSNPVERESYIFEYDTTPLPPYLTVESYTFYTDYWGYYNGKAEKYNSTPREMGDLIGINGRDMTPVESLMKAGILKKIVYPTGGFTLFEFESNKIPVKGIETILGGLRVKEICNYVNDEDEMVLVERKNYRYSGYACSPIDKYKYYYEEPYFYHYYIEMFQNEIKSGLHQVVVNQPLIPLTGRHGGTVFYTDVYEYTDIRNGESDCIHYKYEDGAVPHAGTDDYSDSAIDYRFFSESYNLEKGIPEPLLMEKHYYEDNGNGDLDEKRTELFYYKLCEFPSFITGVHIKMYGTLGLDAGTNIYKPYGSKSEYFDNIKTYNIVCYPGRYMLETKVDRHYTAEGDTIATVNYYLYDDSLRTLFPKTIEIINSDGNSYRTEYEYAFDRNDPVCRSMANDYNMLDQVVCERKFCNDILLSTWQTDYAYKQETDWYYPEYVKASLQGEELEEIYHFAEYDNCGNLLTQVDNTVDTTAIVWGYNSSLPVAKVTGCSYSSLKKIPGMSALLENIAECSDSDQMKNYLSVLRSLVGNGRQVTTYLHRPLFGPSAITNESGYTRYYNYRSDGKLSDIRDDEGVIQTFEYNYTNPVIE